MWNITRSVCFFPTESLWDIVRIKGDMSHVKMCNCATKPPLKHPQSFLAHIHWRGAVRYCSQLTDMGTQEHHSDESCDPELEEADMEGTVTPLAQAHPSHIDAPDGGWGWVVLVATILVLALTLAFPSCMGIFYTDLQIEFSASNSETSWVPSIMTAVLHAGGNNTQKQKFHKNTLDVRICLDCGGCDALTMRIKP